MSLTKKIIIPTVLVGSLALTSGCGVIKPYEKPKYVEIEANQTAFVIPLEGKTSEQGKFESEEFLKEAQVATKRIQIPKKWIKTGRMPGNGEYVDTVRVLVVDRYPETREWKDDLAFIGESKDSIKFKQGISATAQILEDDTAKFLYQYSGKTLKQVMDGEVRNKIGSVLLEKYSTNKIEEIRANKSEVVDYVRKVAEPYFKERGITLSNIGYIGDMQYIDPKIQEAINKKFNAEEDKKAQNIINKKNEEQATSELEQAKKKSQAMKTLSEMKELDIQETIAKGLAEGKIKLPETLIMDGSQGMLFNIPINGQQKPTEK